MSLLGKILTFLNVVAALVFCYLLVVDYARRQHWTYAVYRHDLRLKGLPLTKDDRDVQGNLLVSDLDKTTLNEVFGSPGDHPTNQLDAVERDKRALQQKIDGELTLSVSNPLDPNGKLELATKIQKLAWALRPLAVTAERREGLNRLIADKDNPLTQLRDAFPPASDEK